MTIEEKAARAAHEVCRTYCAAIGEPVLPPWEELPEAHRTGVAKGAAYAIAGGDPAEQHERWRASRVAEGHALGPLDRERKTHPDLVPYAELPVTARVKGDIFRAVCRAVASLG